MRHPRSTIVLVTGLAVLLAAGLAQLHRLRFEAGDVYPSYSTFRAGPVGTKALYEGLAQLPGVSATRALRPLPKLELAPGATLLYLGDRLDNREYMPDEFKEALEAFTEDGGRLVITLMPRDEKPYEPREKEAPDEDEETVDKDGEEDTGENGETEEQPEHTCRVRRTGRGCPGGACGGVGDDWTRVTTWLDLDVGADDHAFHGEAQRTADAPDHLPPTLPCHTLRHLETTNAAWRVLYAREEKAVVMERTFGNGTVVLSALSYVVSNEALRGERQPSFLAWLVGDTADVVFDETHHGVERRFSLMSLARAYGVEHVLLAIAVVMGLFIWKQAVGLLPADRARGDRERDVAEGRGSAAGLVNLLRRAVPRHRLIEEVLAECRREHRDAPDEVLRRIDRMAKLHEAAAPNLRKDLPAQYNLLRTAWKEEQWTRPT